MANKAAEKKAMLGRIERQNEINTEYNDRQFRAGQEFQETLNTPGLSKEEQQSAREKYTAEMKAAEDEMFRKQADTLKEYQKTMDEQAKLKAKAEAEKNKALAN
ncbi:MAG: hypothetical protein GX410_06735 [Elusimicrobia bacterium]|nr:hypothetical protein [Elusimicrobiota bacterium]